MEPNRGQGELEVNPRGGSLWRGNEAYACPALGRVDKMQREEVAQQGNRRRDAHHGFADEGEDRKEGDGFRTQMQHVDLIVGEHDIEEIRKGGNQTCPQGISEIWDLGNYPADGEVGRGPGRRSPTFIEDGGQSQADLTQTLGGGRQWRGRGGDTGFFPLPFFVGAMAIGKGGGEDSRSNYKQKPGFERRKDRKHSSDKKGTAV